MNTKAQIVNTRSTRSDWFSSQDWLRSYTYSHDGNVSTISTHIDSSGAPGTTYRFNEGPDGSAGASDLVFRSVGINGAYYNYYYDYAGRRRSKGYPSGNPDEFFYTRGNQMVVDQGNPSQSGSPTYYPVDDYVWLGGRPIAIVRGKLDATYARSADVLSDTAGSCSREGDGANCGVYFSVTDPIGKPVVMLNASQQIVGMADYDVWGQPNRTTLDSETSPHPYTSAVSGFGNFVPITKLGMSTQFRVKFQELDTTTGCVNEAFGDHVQVVDKGNSTVLYTAGGLHMGTVWTPWLGPTSSTNGARADLVLGTDYNSLTCTNPCFLGCCGYSCNASPITNTTGRGAVVESYEYRRYETGTTPFWTPFRFPGQYHDEETDLNQNWNRFYEPQTGRYLEPEPLWETATPALASARQGTQWPTYAYAANDPINQVDVSGLNTVVVIDSYGEYPGSHAALYVDNGPNGEPALFDPGGSYLGPAHPSSDVLVGAEANLAKFLNWSQLGESDATAFVFPTTPDEEREIASRFGADKVAREEEVTGHEPLSCAYNVSTVISGVGPFQGFAFSIAPTRLGNWLSWKAPAEISSFGNMHVTGYYPSGNAPTQRSGSRYFSSTIPWK